MIRLGGIIDTRQAWVRESSDDGKYVSVGFGNYKEKGKEKDKDAQTFSKDKSGKYIPTKGNDAAKGGNGAAADSDKKVNIFDKPKEKEAKPKKQEPIKWQDEVKDTLAKETKSGKKTNTKKVAALADIFGDVDADDVTKIAKELGYTVSSNGEIVKENIKSTKMMKLLDESDKFNWYDYANDLQKRVEAELKGKNHLGWKLYVDSHSGTFEFEKLGHDMIILATPMWDGNHNVPFNAASKETGKPIEMIEKLIGTVNFRPTQNIEKDVKQYFTILTKMLKKAEAAYPKLNKK